MTFAFVGNVFASGLYSEVAVRSLLSCRAVLPVLASVLISLTVNADLPQRTGRTISGIVEDSSGGTIAGARVTASCGAEQRVTSSDPVGAFQFHDLPATTCRVEARSEFFAVQTLDVDLSARSSAHLRFVLALAGLETEIVVTPRGEQEQTFTVPEAVAVTTREELESRPHQILPQALREETGVLVQQTTAAQGSAFIRGFSAQRIVYLVDGIRFNTSTFRAGATQFLAWVNPGIVQRLEVLRGPASVQYGSDALGGTVNVVSLRPALSPTGSHVSGTIEGLVGAADSSGGLNASVLAQMRRWAIRAGGGGRRVGDLRTGRGHDSRAAVTRFLGIPSKTLYTLLPDSDFIQAGGYVATTFDAGADATVHTLYLHEEQSEVRRHDRMLGGDGLYRSEFDPQRLDFGYLRYERERSWRLDNFALNFSINRQQDDRLEQARPTATIERETGRVVALGYQTQASKQITTRHLATFGGELYDEYIDSSRLLEDPVSRERRRVRPEIPDGTRYTSSGLFLQHVWDITPSRVSLRTGLRYGHFLFRTPTDPSLQVTAERVGTRAVTFHSGGVLGLNRWVNATFSVSRGFRAANAFDLGAIGLSGSGFELAPSQAAALGARIGTSDGPDAVSTERPVIPLSPEAMYAFEAGLKFRSTRVSGSVNAFDLELVDIIQRRTAIFPLPIVGEVIAGAEVVAQDAAGRAFVAADPRPLLTRVNVDRARVKGIEADLHARWRRDWIFGAYFSLTNGRELGTGAFLRRMPPPLGGVRLKWEPTRRSLWVEAVATFAFSQKRLSPGDLADARIGASRSRSSISRFFQGTAVDLGLVQNGVLVTTGETLAGVQERLLGSAGSAPLFTETTGSVALGGRAGWRLGARLEFSILLENLTDRNYRVHGSGIDAPGFNVQFKTRYRF